MIASMTGYGRAVGTVADEVVTVEIRSVNRKGLEVVTSLPREWQSLEAEIVSHFRKKLSRGRVSVFVTVEKENGGDDRFFDGKAVGVALEELEAIAKEEAVEFKPDLKLVADLAMWTRSRKTLGAVEEVAEGVVEIVDQALEEMITMRLREGEMLAVDLSERRGRLVDLVVAIRGLASDRVSDYREGLMRRLRQSGLEFTLEDDRVLKEIAIYADRIDIAEELTRLESHLDQFGEFLEAKEPIGRKFEFLLQEIGREFNTVGSKANESEISRLVIDGKAELERIREQVQNIE